MKRPAFQFYPADWRKDAALQMCQVAARGLWIDMLCLMHEADPYGHLVAAGRPIDHNGLARLVGEPPKDVKRWLDELRAQQVFSVTDDGVIYSRRMVKDEKDRQGWGDRQRKHRDKSRDTDRDKQRDNDRDKPLNVTAQSPPVSQLSSTSVFTEAKASADKSASNPAKNEIWASGRSLLTSQSIPVQQAGTILGKLVKDYTTDVVLEAVRSAVLEQPADARAYLRATCQRMNGERKQVREKDWTSDAT